MLAKIGADLRPTVCQTLGGCIFVSTAQCIFSNILLQDIMRWLPNMDAEAVIRLGATGLQDILSDKAYVTVLNAYMEALSAVFSLAVALASIAVLLIWFIPWIRVDPQHVTYV